MVFEHEIPSGSRLYFKESAKLKREIETQCANYLEDRDFSEIVTPLFSYHQKESFENSRVLVRLNDATNEEVSLRADSTVDVVRIVTKRLKSSAHKRWFYIQPVYSFPTLEQHQVGAEIIDGTFNEVLELSLELLERLDLKFNFQIANIAIAHILVKEYGFEIDDIKDIKLEKILNSKFSWIEKLVEINSIKDLENLDIYPDDLRVELNKIKSAIKNIKIEGVNIEDILISPLYYAPMRYYNSLVFRAFSGIKLYATGGIYKIKGVDGAGFAIYTDDIIANKMQRD